MNEEARGGGGTTGPHSHNLCINIQYDSKNEQVCIKLTPDFFKSKIYLSAATNIQGTVQVNSNTAENDSVSCN